MTFKLLPDAGVIFKAPEAVLIKGTEREVVTATVPVKLAAEEMVCPLIKPEVIAPAPRFKDAPVADPMFGVIKVGVLAKTAAPVPVSSEREVASCEEVIDPVAVPYKVPEVGKVTEVMPVVKRERAFVGEKVIISPPAKVMALVFKVVESETVKVLPSAMVKVEPVRGAVIATLLMEVAEAMPRVGVMKVGEVSKTKLPVPVVPVTEASRLAEVIVDTKFFETSVATNLEAERPEILIVPEEESPVKPESAPPEERIAVGVLMKLVKPVAEAKLMPLMILALVLVATLKLMPFNVLELLALTPLAKVRL